MSFFLDLLRKHAPPIRRRQFSVSVYGLSGEFLKTLMREKVDLSSARDRVTYNASDHHGNAMRLRLRIYADRLTVNYRETGAGGAYCSRGNFREFPIMPGMAKTFTAKNLQFAIEEV